MEAVMETDQLKRILVVADWMVDAHEVAAECRRHAAEQPAIFILTVPAWLHGLGDPEPISAITDVLGSHPATDVLLFTRGRRLPGHPLDLVHRVHRSTGLAVRRVVVGAASRSAHCRPEEA